MKAGEEKIENYLSTEQKSVNGWKISSFFGNREFFNGDWLLRAAGAKAGIYGNDSIEATYPMTRVDANDETLDGSKHKLYAHFPRRTVPAGERLLVGDHV